MTDSSHHSRRQSRYCVLAFLGIVLLDVLVNSGPLLPWTDSSYPASEDEWSYQTYAYLWVEHGKLPYRDIYHEDKTPGIWLIYKFCYEHWGTDMLMARVFVLIASTATALLIFALGATLRGWGVGTIAAVFWIVATMQQAPFCEIFALPFAVLGWLGVYIGQQRRSIWWAIVGGIGLSCALLFKQPWALEFMAVLVYVMFFRNPRRLLLAVGLLVGYAAPLALMAVYLTSQQILVSAWEKTILFPLSSSRASVPYFERIYRLVLRTFDVFIPGVSWSAPFVIALPGQLRRWRQPQEALLLLWLASGTLGALSSGKPSHHQLLQMMPPICLIAALGVQALLDQLNRLDKAEFRFLRRSTIMIGLWVAALPFAGLLTANTMAGASYMWSGHVAAPDPSLPEKLEIARIARGASGPQDCVFTWTETDFVHILADRSNFMGYTNAILARRSSTMKEEMIADLQAAPPAVIIWQDVTGPHWPMRFPALQELIQREYEWVDDVNAYHIFRHITPGATSEPSRDPRPPTEWQ